MAFGLGVEPVDVIVGPGNRWVTAAKQLLTGVVGIDGLAGPSELLVLADDTADPGVVAADLLAQLEHDPDARGVLVTTDPTLPDRVDRELALQLEVLPTRATCEASIGNSFACVCGSLDEAVARAAELAGEGGTVLLAPACASFDMFGSFEERGLAFAAAARSVAGEGGA